MTNKIIIEFDPLCIISKTLNCQNGIRHVIMFDDLEKKAKRKGKKDTVAGLSGFALRKSDGVASKMISTEGTNFTSVFRAVTVTAVKGN